jgi:hypothetical protein
LTVDSTVGAVMDLTFSVAGLGECACGGALRAPVAGLGECARPGAPRAGGALGAGSDVALGSGGALGAGDGVGAGAGVSGAGAVDGTGAAGGSLVTFLVKVETVPPRSADATAEHSSNSESRVRRKSAE